MKKLIFLFPVLLPLLTFAQTPLQLPAVLSNHAVLQASSKVELWGWGPSTIPLKIVCSWNSTDTVTVWPQKDCSWKTTVATPKPGGPYSITFTSAKQKITINDILMGQVWLCSGQSNMEFSYNWGDLDAGNALKTCKNYKIRFFHISHRYEDDPQSKSDGKWVVCDSTAMRTFSLIGYFFGRELNANLHQPVGLIGSYWGGTAVQSWTPGGVYKDTTLHRMADEMEPVFWAPVAPSVLYNAMINPIINYKIAGTIWYQGEQNVGHPRVYGPLFRAMITSWRKKFQEEFPFYFVQIAPWNGYSGINGALLREQQATALTLPKTGMVTIGDLVNDVTNIHPKMKRGVALRLSDLALKEVYGFKNPKPYQPHYISMKIKRNKAFITVKSYGQLKVKGKTIKSFQIAGSDKVFYPAKAILKRNGDIEVFSSKVKHPVAVRYCFTNAEMPNLFDVNGLPLKPFRTDKW